MTHPAKQSPSQNPLLSKLKARYRSLRRKENPSLGGKPNQTSQLALMQSYRLLAATAPKSLPRFNEVGFRAFSQFEEDGILLYLFSLLGTTNRTCVEICAGDGSECNTTNLIINHGWWGHLFDGRERNVEAGKQFFSKHPDTYACPPKFNHAWITVENVNELVTNSGASGEIDLLSLDLDGNDYWIWKALTAVDPRVVVCEVHNPVPPHLAITIPYSEDFIFEDDYRGASLAAMNKLAEQRNYRLVGVHRYGFNAFFVKNGLGDDLLPKVSVESCTKDPFSLDAQKNRWPAIANKPWVTIP